jgi:hypothetical protein
MENHTQLFEVVEVLMTWRPSDLTNRSSQPLAVAMRRFDFVKEFSMLRKLGAASGG